MLNSVRQIDYTKKLWVILCVIIMQCITIEMRQKYNMESFVFIRISVFQIPIKIYLVWNPMYYYILSVI